MLRGEGEGGRIRSGTRSRGAQEERKKRTWEEVLHPWGCLEKPRVSLICTFPAAFL